MKGEIMSGTYVKKRIEVQAWQWNGISSSIDDAPQWVRHATGQGMIIRHAMLGFLRIATLEGEMRAESGDWIIRGGDGVLSAETNEDFAMMYDEAEPKEQS